jgi:Holliday junction resolvase RusA-like endonuclease
VAGCAFAAWTLARFGFGVRRKPRLPLRIVVTVRGGRADADNYLKLILDGLADGIHIDDKHFNPVTVSRVPKGLLPAGVLIEVYEALAASGAT